MRVDARHRKAAALLANGTPIRHVAVEVGVDNSTMHRWLAKPEFTSLVDRLKEKQLGPLEKAAAMLHAGAPIAVQCLLDAAAEGDVGAARAILDRVGLPAGVQLEVTAAQGEPLVVQLLRALQGAEGGE